MPSTGPLHDAFRAQLEAAMTAGGWRDSRVPPVRLLPFDGRYYRELPNGWAAAVAVRLSDVDRTEPPHRSPDVRALLSVAGGATFPAAERLLALLGYGGRNLGFAGPPFGGDEDAEIEIRDASEIAATFSRLATHLDEVLLPWARTTANLESWTAADAALADDEWYDDRGPIVMLLAHGEADRALERLEAADAAAGRDDMDQRAFSDRVRAFVADGAEIPASAGALFVHEPIAPAPSSVFSEDPLKVAFVEAQEEELQDAPLLARVRHLGGQVERAARLLGGLRSEGRVDEIVATRWVSVAYEPVDERTLAEAFHAGGRPIADRVDVEVELRPAGEDEARSEVLLLGRVVGRLSGRERPSDVPAYPIGPTRARLTRKRREPRYLLEVRLQAPGSS